MDWIFGEDTLKQKIAAPSSAMTYAPSWPAVLEFDMHARREQPFRAQAEALSPHVRVLIVPPSLAW